MIKKYIYGSLLLYLILISFYYYGTREYAIETIKSSANELLENYKAFRHYSSQEQRQEIDRLQEQGVLDGNYFSSCLMSTSYGVNSINAYYNTHRIKNDEKPIDVGFASDNPRNPSNEALPFESEILKKFNTGELKEYSKILTKDGEDVLYYAIPTMRNSKACMQCHSDPRKAPIEMVKKYGDKNGFWEKEGEIRAVIKAVYSLDDHLAKANHFFLLLSLATFIVLGAILYIVLKFSRELEKKADSLKKANIELAKRVNELKSKDKLLIRQSKLAAMGEMIGIIAHQWKQPLNTLNLMIEDIELTYKDKNMTQKYMEDFRTNAYKKIFFMSRTIDDFRDFFHPDKTEVSFCLKESIASVVAILKPALIKAHINVEIIGETIEISSIKGEIEQVILNIINNAKDALVDKVDSQRKIVIEILSDKERVEIKISDNAGGIQQHNLQKIFDSYFSTKGESGTGIGLYMSKMIIEDSLRGEIKGYNNKDGAVFHIILPRKFS